MGFGSREELECVQEVKAPGPNGEGVCLATKHTFHELGLPAYVTDDGFVLWVLGTTSYYPLSDAQIAAGQREGSLPDPMPAHALPVSTYLLGYSLWIVIALVGGYALFSSRRARRRRSRDAATPLSTEPPTITTAGDRFIQAQLASRLDDGEAITHQGYGTAVPTRRAGFSLIGLIRKLDHDAGNKGILAALTAKRIFLIDTAVIGLALPALKSRRVEVIDRARIRRIVRADDTLVIDLDDDTLRRIVVDRRKRHFSNQDAFLLDLPRLVKQPAAA
jgi:hypothetical protein